MPWGAAAEDHPVEAWDKLMNLNVRGYFILSQHIAKRSMIPRKQGRIINVASRAAFRGETEFADYGASKAALNRLANGLGAELYGSGVRVNAVEPGWNFTTTSPGWPAAAPSPTSRHRPRSARSREKREHRCADR